MDGADGKALSSQGILAGTEYEYYKPFDDAPEYEEYKEVPTWLKVVAGVAVAAVVGLAVAATAASDKKNGTESSLGDYISNAFSASARVGASCIAITLGMYGAEVMTLTVSGGLGLIPVGGTVVTLPQLAGAFQLVAGIVTSQNLLFQIEEVLMFCTSGKEMGAPTGNWLYDSARELTEMASMQFAVYGLMNPYTYQRPKITPLPNETSLTVPGGTGVAVVPNGTVPALNPPYLPEQYTEYPAAVQGWAQQALPGGGSGIETSYGKSSGKIGDFTELEGSTVDEILDRIPDEAVLRELYPVQGGATEGFEFKWVQNGQTYRVRVHNVDPSAPVGSNAYNGWVVRAQRGRRYFDPTINDFREAKYFNPNGPDYDEVIINDTHIPILDPYQN